MRANESKFPSEEILQPLQLTLRRYDLGFVMKKRIAMVRNICAELFLGSAMLFFTGCVTYAPGPDGYYDYDYYPERDVYFYSAGGIYYWNDGGHWRHGRHLPPQFALHQENREHLQLHTRQPWTEHSTKHVQPPHVGGVEHH
jgi:hypothetical protein